MGDIIFALFLLVCIKSFGQNFEGSLRYKMNIEISDKMKEMGATKNMLIKKMKSEFFFEEVTYAYKHNNYLIETNNKNVTSA